MPPEASLSAMSIADGGSNDAPPQESKKSMLSLLKADYHKTLRKAAIMHRRSWCKTGQASMRLAAAPIFFRGQVHGIGWSAVWLHVPLLQSRRMVRLPSRADGMGSLLLGQSWHHF